MAYPYKFSPTPILFSLYGGDFDMLLQRLENKCSLTFLVILS